MSGVHTIETRTHGRYLVEPPDGRGPHRWLVGFHGQAETAAIQMVALQAMRPDAGWGLASIQGLNRYYTRAGAIVSGWMTREDRELAIADNVAYVGTVLAALADRHGPISALAYSGFSQGVAMAYRAAAFVPVPCTALVVLGGDVPPDVDPASARLPPVLLGRGDDDGRYPAPTAEADVRRLDAGDVPVEFFPFRAGHAYAQDFTDRARAFLRDAVRHTAAGATAS